jgi:hypothetical protein
MLYTWEFSILNKIPTEHIWNSFGPCVNWTKSKRRSKAFQDASRGPKIVRVNVTFGGEDSNTLAKVSFL